jgi:hypothetical protein
MYAASRYLYENHTSLSHELCDEIIHLFNEEECKSPGMTQGGINLNVKDTLDYEILVNNPKWSKIRQCLIDELIYNIEIYIDLLDTLAYNSLPIDINNSNIKGLFKELDIETLNLNTLMIQQYKSNKGRYIYHNDFAVDTKLSRYRVLTYIWYLNDVNEGGETIIWDNHKIKPTTGKLLLFPATWTYPHSGLMPISNDKYIITGWVYQCVDLSK